MRKPTLTIISLLLMCLLASFACIKPPPLPPSPPPSVPPGSMPPLPPSPPKFLLNVDVTADKTVYLPTEGVTIDVPFTNVAAEPVHIEPSPPVLQVMRPRPDTPIWSYGPGTRSESLEPGAVTGGYSWGYHGLLHYPLAVANSALYPG